MLRSQCLDEVTKALVSHDSSGLFAAWHLAWLEVESSGQSYLFKHGDWVQSTGASKQATVRFPDTRSIRTNEVHGLLLTVGDMQAELLPSKQDDFLAEHEYLVVVKTAE